ncbi:MAG: TRAP transporter substrate-binding protein DctP [Rhizobiales bacterium]|nr:TRAP transporter substrate-binding protein DctP [Hyphomicrobiales bacterium]
MLKWIVASACSALLVGASTAAMAQPASRPTLRIVSPFAADSPIGTSVQSLAAALRERLSSQFAIELVRADGPVLAMLSSGRAEIAITPTTDLKEASRDAFALYDVPFLFASVREVSAVQQTGAGVGALASLQQSGLVGLGYWNNGVNTLLTRRHPSDANDLRGQKIRVPNAGGAAAVIQFGATSVILPFAEVGMAVTAGQVDGFEASPRFAMQIFAGQANQETFAAVQLRPVVATIVMRDANWRQLSYRAQSVIAEETAKAGLQATETAFSQDSEALQSLVARGNVTSRDTVAFSQSAQPIWQRAMDAGTIDAVLPVIQQVRRTSPPPGSPERRGAVDNPPMPAPAIAGPGALRPGEVLFATDRAFERDPEPRYRVSGRRGELAFGLARFEIAPNRPMGNIEERLSPMRALDTLPGNQFASRLAAAIQAAEKKEVVVFVHGFNNAFDDAARALALMSADIHFGGVPVLYSWPSDGVALRYPSDEDEVRASRNNFLTFIEAVRRTPGVSRIHVAAHSMGNRLVVEAIDRFDAQAGSGAQRLFHHVVMAAPDVYLQLFQQTSDAFRRHAQRITLYASDRDTALVCSRWVHANKRLGEAGADIFIAPGVETIDASDAEPAPPWYSPSAWPGLPWLFKPCARGHAYMMRSIRIQSDLQNLVRTDSPPGSRHGLAIKQRAGADYWAFRPAE